MSLLSFLLDNIAEKSQIIPAISIDHITNNSRDVIKNTLFLAYPGEKSDGRRYIAQAIENGAAAIAYEPSDDFIVVDENNIPCIPVRDLKIIQSLIAARFYDFPSTKIPIIGVTGTNGKTSITQFIAQSLSHCAVIGTIGYGFLENMSSDAVSGLKKTQNTTPDGLQLQHLFSGLIHDGAEIIAMEVSSHALVQHRVNDVQFHTAVFTNLTQDHLDFHGSMENYRDAKALLFQHPGLKNAVINIDDATGHYFSQKYRSTLTIITYSQQSENADITVQKCTSTQHGFNLTVKTPWGTGDFHLPLIGAFNIENALATLGVLGTLKMPFDAILRALSCLKTVNGRMQLFHQKNTSTVIVDYAHTPDALEKVLQHVRTHCDGQLWCVFGCGGDRDKSKRPKMGAIAAHLSDHVIITNDNPRSENPLAIAQEILGGITHKTRAQIELNRVKAIEYSIHTAKENDWIVIAGKGHETEQIIGDEVRHHSDSECVRHQLESVQKNNEIR